jgi:iron complex outermembrane receptor protein
MKSHSSRVLGSAILASLSLAALANDADIDTSKTETLPKIEVTADANADDRDRVVPANMPSPSHAITAAQLDAITVVNAEDALKYAPNLHVRKRFIGDNNAIVSVRSTSSRQSARTLVYADGLLLSNLLGSDFGFPPRWSLVSADEIARVDVLYGPYSARFPGNSLGATILINTRMPEKFEASATAQWFTQSYDRHGIDKSFDGHKESAYIGSRSGPWSYLLGLEHLDSTSQPVSFYTTLRSTTAASSGDTPVSGGVAWRDQLGRSGYLLGVNSEGSTANINDQAKFKLAYDFTPNLQAALTVVDWRQDFSNDTGSFLRDANGNIVSTGNIAIDGLRYTLPDAAFAPANGESHRRLYGLSLRSSNEIGWNYSLVASLFDTRRDITRTASGPGDGAGTAAFGDGTGWHTFDAEADYRAAAEAAHWISFGFHSDAYDLDNATWNNANWQNGDPSSFNNAFRGKTSTQALYIQDAWSFAPAWKLIAGLRYEAWTASHGLRSLGEVTQAYPKRSDNYWSPKLALERDLGEGWNARLSLARAYRLPTVSELFQGRISDGAIINNDPNLKPEDTLSKDLTLERVSQHSRLRFSLYEDDVRDALFSQTNTTVFPTITNIQNVDRVRTRGAEVAFEASDLIIKGFDLSASVARNHARTLRNTNFPASVGKNFYRIPDWRADLVGSYRVNPWLSGTVAARYSGRQYNTLDNSDINPDTFGGTSRYLVIDAKIGFTLSEHASLGLGVENLNNEQYFVYHPYPGRTYYAEAKYRF